jgi:aminoglycoside 2'-N-acetyltransferase I
MWITFEIQPDHQQAPAERAEMKAWLEQAFGVRAADYKWTEPDWRLCAWEGERRVGHVDITERQARVGDHSIYLGGVGGVITLPEWRRQGIASQMLLRTAAFLRQDLGVDFGLLICDPKLELFYARRGWQTAPGPLVFDQPGGKVVFEETVMILPARESAWPVGTIDLCGLPW